MTQYNRAYKKELGALHELERKGFATFRSAGSRGKFDVGGIGRKGILLVQVKRERRPSKDPARKYERDILSLKKLEAPNSVRKELAVQEGMEEAQNLKSLERVTLVRAPVCGRGRGPPRAVIPVELLNAIIHVERARKRI